MQHKLNARSLRLAVRFSYSESISSQFSHLPQTPLELMGVSPLRRPWVPVVMRSYRTLNPFVLSRLGSASTTQSLTSNCRYASPQRDDSSRIRIHDPSKRNGIDGHSDYLIHVIFRLFSIASDRQTSYPSPLNELSRIITTSNGSRLEDRDFLLDRAGVRAKALDFLHEILALDDLTCGEEKRKKKVVSGGVSPYYVING